jgi:large subunit ribosomal protein L5
MSNKPATVIKTSTARLQALYQQKLVDELQTELQLPNRHEVPRLEKIVINAGLGRAQDDKRQIEVATNTIRKITGQQPLPTIAKKSIASFKLRQGSKIGLKVTLRGSRMYEFLDRLINIVLPRLRDFHGLSSQAFDKSGNYNLGFIDQTAFPELTFEETTPAHGLQVGLIIRCREPAHARELLAKFGLPFEKEKK